MMKPLSNKNTGEENYRNPESILVDDGLTPDEKDRILHEWEQDQIALLRAADENMNGREGDGRAGDTLRRIKETESILDRKKRRQ